MLIADVFLKSLINNLFMENILSIMMIVMMIDPEACNSVGIKYRLHIYVIREKLHRGNNSVHNKR